jgi:hypothetical protein
MRQLIPKIRCNDGLGPELCWQLVFAITNEVDHDRVVHGLLSNILDERGDGGREDHGAKILVSAVVLNGDDIILKSHVEHSVSFIQDEVFNF